jgi:hypothetical protein
MKIIDLGNGAECIINNNGDKFWYLNDKWHRTDGPACEYANGSKSWYLNGKYHRTDGPAIEWANGYKKWWVNGKEYFEEEFNMVKEVLWMI